MALHQNETIFLHNTIHVFTNNASVLHIHRYKPTNSRKKRLINYISQYGLHIHYIPGRNNKLADCLSRLPEDLKSSDVVHFTLSDTPNQEEFLLPIIKGHSSKYDFDDPEPTNKSNDRTNEWIGYKIEIGKRITDKIMARR